MADQLISIWAGFLVHYLCVLSIYSRIRRAIGKIVDLFPRHARVELSLSNSINHKVDRIANYRVFSWRLASLSS